MDAPAVARRPDMELQLQLLAQCPEAFDRGDAPAAHVVDQIRHSDGVQRCLTDERTSRVP